MKKYIFMGVVFILFISAAYSKRLDVGKDKVVKVNNHIITLKELEKKYNELLKLLPEGQKLTKKEVLQSMIEQELLLEEIRGAKSLVLNEEHFKQMLDQQKMLYSQLMTRENSKFKFNESKFKTYIEKELKITYEKYEQKIKEQVLARQYIEKKAQKKLQTLRTKKYSSKSDFPVILPDMRGGLIHIIL